MVLATANGRDLSNTVVTAFTHRFSEFGGMTLFVVSSDFAISKMSVVKECANS